jgi:hypothetical protein
MRSRALWFIIIGLLLCGCGKKSTCPVDRIDLAILLARMTNLNTFAEAPLGDSFMMSSYDRTGGNQDWFVYTKTQPNGRIKVFEAEGPGYVSRIWIATFAAKRWLFFFDGETEPRLILDRDDLFGGAFPFVSPLAGMSGGGRYSMVPMPFSKSLRIEMEPKHLKPTNRNYIHINYTLLDLKPAAVESFPHRLTAGQSNQVAAVNAALNRIPEEQALLAEACLSQTEGRGIPPGGKAVFWDDDGAGLMSAFAIRIDAPSPSEAMSGQLLRKLRLKMYWDGEETPSVDVPLGDFFCNPFYYREYTSMPLGLTGGAFICRFPMPYRNGARCELINHSELPVTVSIGASGSRGNTDGLHRRFHAAWSASDRSGYPLKILKTPGPGHYVGCFLTAIGQDGTWTILEGDEFLRPDPGKQPPQLGTGLEDYFNGAYYYTSLFDLPFHGLIEKGAMRTDQYRLHMLDAVQFSEKFEAEIEFGDRNQARGYMSSIAYWYADKAASMPLPTWQEMLLTHPPDRFELQGLMAPMFMLERDGLYADAASRMESFAVRYQQQPWVDVLKARVLGYREKSEGFDAVRDEYMALASSSFPPAARAAKDRLWLEEDSSHALLGIHALAKYTLLLDGNPVAEGAGTGNLEVHRLAVAPGSHVWQVELEPTHQGSFFTLCLRTAYGDVTSAGEWDEVNVVELAGRARPESFAGKEVLPNMTLWAFEPTAYVDMQSPAAGIKLWSFWDAKPLVRRLVLKKEWELEEVVATSAEMEQDRDEDELRAHAID